MKANCQILLLSAFLLLSQGAFAQQQEQKITGVTINPDNSVTFRYRNPKAVTVEVSGEFMEGSARLREVDGVWTYTTPPLASEMYFYGLTVDGQPILDLNYSMVKDIPRWMNYYIGCGTEDFLYRSVLAYNKQLDEIGFPYHFRETPGGHTWAPWRIYLTEMTQMLFKGL